MIRINKKIKIILLFLGALVLTGGIAVPMVFFGKAERKTMTVIEDWVPVNKNQLVWLTDTTVVGTVESVRTFIKPSEVMPGEKEVHSRVALEVGSYLYNPKDFSFKSITILSLGGEAGGVRTIAENETPLEIGHKYVVFLKQQGNDQAFSIVAGFQGAFELAADGTVGVGERQQTMVQNVFGHPLTLEQLKAEISTAKPEPIPGMKN